MAWIEADQDLWKAIWVDGYLPSSKLLEKTRHKYLDLDRGGYLIKRPYLSYSDDEMFKRLALVIRGDSCEREKPKQGDLSYLFHHCDLFLTRFATHPSVDYKKVMSSIKADFELGSSLKKELEKGNQAENYRQIILVFSPYVCNSGEECTREFMKKLNFKIREPKEYDKFGDFKKDCNKLLERYFLEPYIAPCMVAEYRLNLLGFEIKEPDI